MESSRARSLTTALYSASAGSGGLIPAGFNANAAQNTAISNKVVNHLIQQAVAEFVNCNEVTSPSSTAHKALHKYLANPTTVDIVYAKAMEKVRADKTNNRALVTNCIQLLKSHLFAFPPKTETLIQLERFCIALQPDTEQLAKSIKYVRGIIANRLLQNTKDEAIILAEMPSGDRSSLSVGTGSIGLDKDAGGTPALLVPLTASLTPDGNTGQNPRHSVELATMTNNFLSQRTAAYSFRLQPRSSSNVTLATFCDTFRFVGPIVSDQQILHIHDASQTRDRISAVSLAKKREETKSYREAGQLTVRRKGVHLFHYKYYKEQVALDLTEEEKREVYDIVINPEADHESCLIGSKILIKLVIDMLCREDFTTAKQLLVDLATKMFKTNHSDRKLHAFNLIFNISIHANLIDEIVLTEYDEKKAISPLVLSVLDHLFDVVREVLRLMLRSNEKDTKVWATALNCLLFFIVKQGKVDVKKLHTLDVELIPTFIRHLWDSLSHDRIMRELIFMLVSVIYQNKPFDVDAFNRCCNIDFIIHIYRRTPSVQALENLFTVIFDYTIHRYVTKKLDTVSSEQAELLLALFKRAGAPLFLTDIFKFTPKNMVESLARVLCLDYYAKELKLDKDFALSVIRGLKKLARSFLEVDSEYKSLIQVTLNASKHGSSGVAAAVDTLGKLLRNEALRPTGQEWLLSLMIATINEPRSLTPNVVSSLEKIITELLSSSDPLLRRVFIFVTEQLVLYLRSKTHQATEDEALISRITNVINTHVGRLIKVGEKNEANLMLVFDIIMNVILIYSPGKGSDIEEIYGDSPSTLFANGRAVASQVLIHKINTEIFCHLFTNLPARQQARVTLLLLIIEHCKNKTVLQKVGGLSFFRSLLTDYPDIVYYASRFLIEQFQSEKPEQFQALLTQLVNKAQQTNNEQLLDNSYLQIRALTGSLL